MNNESNSAKLFINSSNVSLVNISGQFSIWTDYSNCSLAAATQTSAYLL